MKLYEIAVTKKKAGFLPYVMEDGVPTFMFMVPSDTAYGGPKPGIAKGHVDQGEDFQEAGIREAEEELGLKRSNLKQGTVKLAWKGELTGLDATYIMAVFMGECKSKEDFGDFHFETGSVHWLTAEEFKHKGRASQAFIVTKASSLLGA